jgi:hypothetical protein
MLNTNYPFGKMFDRLIEAFLCALLNIKTVGIAHHRKFGIAVARSAISLRTTRYANLTVSADRKSCRYGLFVGCRVNIWRKFIKHRLFLSIAFF